MATASAGKAPEAEFGRQHHRVAAFEDGGGDVGHLGAGRHRRGDHRFEHLGGDDHRLAGAAAGAGDLLLDAGHALQRHLDAEVATGDHERVGVFDDRRQAFDRLRLLDLGEDAGAAAGELAHLGEVFRALDERQRDPVDAGVERRFQVGTVLRRQRAEGDGGVGNADALAVGEVVADLDRGDHAPLGHLGDAQAHAAVVEQQPVAGFESGKHFRVGQLDAGRVAGVGIVIEHEALADHQVDGLVGEHADPELRSLQVDENADRVAFLGLDLADGRHQLAHELVIAVAHVDAEDIRARPEELLDHRLFGRCRPQRCENLGSSRPPHVSRSVPCWSGSVSWTVQLFCSPVSTSKNPVFS